MSEKLSMTDLVAHTVSTKLTIPQTNGTWSGNEHTSVMYLPVNCSDSYKIYRKIKEDAIQRKAIWESMYHITGGVDTNNYLKGIQETERALQAAEELYNFPAVSLLIVNKNSTPNITNELFEDAVLANAYTVQVLGVTLEDIQTNNLPDHLIGTRIFKQNWHTSKTNLARTSLKPTEVNDHTKPIGTIE
ncbi:MAG: hypothetical protein ABS904_00035 [Solibacillus isronensis]